LLFPTANGRPKNLRSIADISPGTQVPIRMAFAAAKIRSLMQKKESKQETERPMPFRVPVAASQAATVLLENAGINVGEQNQTKASSQRN
jgi:hypothetical protein